MGLSALPAYDMNRRLFISRRASGGLSVPLTAFSCFICAICLFAFIGLAFLMFSYFCLFIILQQCRDDNFSQVYLSILTCRKLASSKRFRIPFFAFQKTRLWNIVQANISQTFSPLLKARQDGESEDTSGDDGSFRPLFPPFFFPLYLLLVWFKLEVWALV